MGINDKKEACKTFIKQTKQLITLSSTFILAPVGISTLFIITDESGFSVLNLKDFFWAECMFISSVIVGYVVLGSISGSQDKGTYDVYRKATRIFSIIQFGLFIVGTIFLLTTFYSNF